LKQRNKITAVFAERLAARYKIQAGYNYDIGLYCFCQQHDVTDADILSLHDTEYQLKS